MNRSFQLHRFLPSSLNPNINLNLLILPLLVFCGCKMISTQTNPYQFDNVAADADSLAPGEATLVRCQIRSVSGGNAPDSVTFTTSKGYFVDPQDSAVLGATISVLPQEYGKAEALLFNPFTITVETATVTIKAGDQEETLALLFLPGSGSGPACAISMKGIDFEEISIRGGGKNEISRITFQVTGTAGFPVDDGVVVVFSKQGPGGAPAESLLITESAAQAGLVSTAVRSGTRAGTVLLTATIRGTSISSAVVPLVIQGGLPHKGYSLLVSSARNIPGAAVAGATATITGFYYDAYHNPVQTGTAVYFTGNTGGITASGFVNASGQVSATFASGRDTPANRLAILSASTTDDSSNQLRDSCIVLLSGPTVVRVAVQDSLSLAPGDTLHIPQSSSRGVVLTVCDDVGNPLAAGTSIAVTVSAGRTVNQSTILLEDTMDRSRTQFVVQWMNDRTITSDPELAYLNVQVTSRNGDKQAGLWAILD